MSDFSPAIIEVFESGKWHLYGCGDGLGSDEYNITDHNDRHIGSVDVIDGKLVVEGVEIWGKREWESYFELAYFEDPECLGRLEDKLAELWVFIGIVEDSGWSISAQSPKRSTDRLLQFWAYKGHDWGYDSTKRLLNIHLARGILTASTGVGDARRDFHGHIGESGCLDRFRSALERF